ncbi:uncharacterized protein LOC144034645 [Vanacampus margaritifer]
MTFHDHAYTSTTFVTVSHAEPIYNWSLKEAEELVKLRVSNKYLFSEKRNTSAWAWMAILRQMGLQHKLNHSQASAKWHNLRKRYTDLKGKSHCYMWPLFTLMDDAMEGRLDGSGPILEICGDDKFYISPRGKNRKITSASLSSAKVTNVVPEIEVTLNGDSETEEEEGDGNEDENGMEGSQEFMSQDEAMEREKRSMELERIALQRDRALLEREIAIVDRDRALMDRERLLIEREKEMVAKGRDAVNRERLALKRRKAALEKPASQETTKNRTERFLDLFEKLIDSF